MRPLPSPASINDCKFKINTYLRLMIRRLFLGIIVTTGCFLALALTAQNQFDQDCAKLAAQSGGDSERLHQLFKLEWDHAMHENPEMATDVGYPGQNDRWTDESLEAIERRKLELQPPMKVVQSIDRSKLSATDQLNY